MIAPWSLLLLASGLVLAVENSTANAVSSSAHTARAQAAVNAESDGPSRWDYLTELGNTVRDALYQWSIDDSLVLAPPAFAAPTPPPAASWTLRPAAEVAAHYPPAPSPSPLPAAPLRKHVPLPTPASRPSPTLVASIWHKWPIAPPTATPSPPAALSPGPVATPHVAIGPRLPTSPLGSFNGTELPVPGHTCSPGDRPRKPRYIVTRRPPCPFSTGDFPQHIVCPGPEWTIRDTLAPPEDPTIVIDLIPVPNSISRYLTPPPPPLLEPPTSSTNPISLKVGSIVLMLLFVYAIYLVELLPHLSLADNVAPGPHARPSIRLPMSLPPGVADAIRAGNIGSSHGGRRVRTRRSASVG